jgi:hypothetical protein
MRWRGRFCLLLLLITGTRAGAQMPDNSLTDPPQFHLDYMTLLRKDLSLSDAPPAPLRTARLQMFRMPSGFNSMPLSLVPDDDPPPEDPLAKTDDELGIVQIAYGNHVPYLDMAKRGDPGGFGYYKIHSQVQIFDLGTTSVSLAVQALAPMGFQSGGVNGPTFLSPALACFHDLGDGAAIHAFVGQELTANARWRDQLQSSLRCGFAVQRPLPFTSYGADQGLFVFVQALGQYGPDATRADIRSITWDVIPGLQYRVSNSCWMSMGISRYQFMSCVWQY